MEDNDLKLIFIILFLFFYNFKFIIFKMEDTKLQLLSKTNPLKKIVINFFLFKLFNKENIQKTNFKTKILQNSFYLKELLGFSIFQQKKKKYKLKMNKFLVKINIKTKKFIILKSIKNKKKTHPKEIKNCKIQS